MHLVLVQLDALSFSYFSPEHTPFLWRLGQSSIRGRLETMLAYDGINASILTGHWPSTHGIWTGFIRDPARSPLRRNPFRVLGALRRGVYNADGSRVDGRPNRRPLRTLRRAFQASAPNHPLFQQGFTRIPAEYAHQFRNSVVSGAFQTHRTFNGVPTFYGVLAQHGLTERTLHGELDVLIETFRRDASLAAADFISLHTLWGLDWTAHHSGPFHPDTLAFVRRSDGQVETLVETITERLGGRDNVTFLFFSDHGMKEVVRHVDIGELRRAAARRSSLTLFIDSTLVRAWGTPADLQLVTDFFAPLKCGRVLNHEDLARLHLDFMGNAYGDLIFHAEPGNVFVPDYFFGVTRVKGMHGYEPGPVELDGILLLHGPDVAPSTPVGLQMPDLFGAMLDVLELPQKYPNVGRSLPLR